MKSSTVFRAVLVLLVAGVFGNPALAEDSARSLEESNLLFSIIGTELAVVPIVIEENQSRAVTYDLGREVVGFQLGNATGTLSDRIYDDPLFCFDFSDDDDALVTLEVDDANGHRVIDGLRLTSPLQYVLSYSFIQLSPSPDAQCFYHGDDSGDFGLFGVAPSGGDNGDSDDGSLFSDAFMAVDEVELTYEGLSSFVSSGAIEYDLVLTNKGNSVLQDIALQEVFPENADFYPATLRGHDVVITSSGHAVCPDSTESDYIRTSGISLNPGDSCTFSVIATVPSGAEIGASIHLHAGAVAGSGSRAAFDTAEAVLTVIGDGNELSAVSEEAQVDEEAVITVTALDGEGNPVPDVDVERTDAGGLDITPGNASTGSEEPFEAIFEATVPDNVAGDYVVEFDADDLDDTEVTVTFTAADADQLDAEVVADTDNATADGNDQVIFEAVVHDAFDNPVSAEQVSVSDHGGLESLDGATDFTDSDGRATFAATSTSADSYTVEFVVDGADPDDATATFVAGAPAELTFVQQPTDTIVDEAIDPPVVVRVLDEHGNWVDTDNETELEVIRRGGGASSVFLAENVAVENGEASFANLVMDEIGEAFYLEVGADFPDQSQDDVDSEFFDVVEAPDELSVTLGGFNEMYSQGDSQSGEEQAAFVYDEGAGDIEQIFNVFRVLDEDGNEIDAGTYDDLFVSISYGPTGYEDYIRGLTGTSEDNVVAPETVDIEIFFKLESDAPTGEYQLELTSYDVSDEEAGEVSLADANAGDYDVLAAHSIEIQLVAP